MPTKFEQSLAVLTDYYLSNLPSIIEGDEFSAKFKKRMEKLIRRYAKPYYILINTAAKRAACIIISIIIALSALTISVRAFLPDVWNMIVEWFDEYILVGFNFDSNTAPDTIEDIRPPKLSLDGIEITGTLIGPHLYQTDYCKDGYLVCRVRQYTYQYPFKLDDDSFIQSVSVYQHYGIMSMIDSDRYLSWEDSEYYYIITNYKCYLSDDEMIAIAESIYK